MKKIQIRNITLGAGRPKICVPFIGATTDQLLVETERVKETKADLVEWRVDFFNDALDVDKVLEALEVLHDHLGDTPILFTFRTGKEGGEKHIETDHYIELYAAALNSGHIDLIDVELMLGEEVVLQVKAAAHKKDVPVVVSYHNFICTPSKKEIVEILTKMRKLGADIPKVATMPLNFADVLVLLAATDEYSQVADCPIITMSMKQLGSISRIAGQFSGSVLSFGSLQKASAPGQLAVNDLATILEILGD